MALNVFEADSWQDLTVGQALASMDEQRKQRKRHGPGKAVAIVVIDMQVFFMRDGDPVSDASIGANAALLARAREFDVPVFLVQVYHESIEQLSHTWRLAGGSPVMGRDNPVVQFHPGLGKQDSDIVVVKRHASGFMGTDLDEQLRALGIDTILLTGTSTSGCVRATAVDGSARLYRVMVVEECVYEPRRISGPVALSDVASRYADIVTLNEAMEVIERLAK